MTHLSSYALGCQGSKTRDGAGKTSLILPLLSERVALDGILQSDFFLNLNRLVPSTAKKEAYVRATVKLQWKKEDALGSQ